MTVANMRIRLIEILVLASWVLATTAAAHAPGARTSAPADFIQADITTYDAEPAWLESR